MLVKYQKYSVKSGRLDQYLNLLSPNIEFNLPRLV